MAESWDSERRFSTRVASQLARLVARKTDGTPLFVAELPDGEPRNLTAELDRPVNQAGWADMAMAEDDPGPLWLDGGSLLTIVSDRGRNIPYRIGLEGSAEPLVEPGEGFGARIGRDGRRADQRSGERGNRDHFGSGESGGLAGGAVLPGRGCESRRS